MTDRQKYKSIYWAWKAMKQRCQNEKCQAYKNYGARGISVCEERQPFEPFLEWCLSHGYRKGLDIDRIDNNGDYCPENCRWVSRKENSNNTRLTTIVKFKGEEIPASVLEERLLLPKGVISYWVRNHGKQYAEDRLLEVDENGYKAKDYGYSHKKAIQHEDGTLFDSVRECAKFYGLAPCTISNAIRNNKSTRAGSFHFV